jgi:SAM-dependent methyltransferase
MARLDLSPLVKAVRDVAVGNRYARVLATHIADAIPHRGIVLDVGCGDGATAAALMRLRPDLTVVGVDIDVDPDARIPVVAYDGEWLPYEDEAFDYVMLVDALYRAPDPGALLAEAARVAAQGVVVKDLVVEGLLAGPTLRLMHRFGSRAREAAPPTLGLEDWQSLFYRSRLATISEVSRLGLYPPPLSWIFDRKLHFVALLGPRQRLG